MNLRPGFAEIVTGWMLIDDFDDLTDRIECAALWTKENGPLNDDEEATIKLMIEAQVARGVRRGDFEPYIDRDTEWPPEWHTATEAAAEALASDETPDLKLGPCCICTQDDVRITAIVMLDVKGQVPGHGWGCVACNLPTDGASAVLCASCCEGWNRGQVELQFACRGYPAHDGRVPIGELTVPHVHDPEIDHDG